MSGPLTEIYKKGEKAGLAYMTVAQKAARQWFRREAMHIVEMDPNDVLSDNPGKHKRNKMLIGRLYFFMYDAKTKDKLPYWDRFPLIFPIQEYEDGFLGINMHYLPYDYRAQLMDGLYTMAQSNEEGMAVRLNISYSILKESSKTKNFKPCVKRYLTSHVQSSFYQVNWKEWPVALFLPVERFEKQSKQHVWSESVKKIHQQLTKIRAPLHSAEQ
jgi:hypothetical protein